MSLKSRWLGLGALLLVAFSAGAAQQFIIVGAADNDKTGDPLRVAGQKINANFTDLYSGASLTSQPFSIRCNYTASLSAPVDCTASQVLSLLGIGNGLTSVALTAPSWLTVAGSPLTSNGTLALSATAGLTANQFLSTPNGSSGALALRAIVAADLPAIDLTSKVTNTLPVINGGDGLATATLGDIRYASGTNTLAALPGNTSATKNFLTQTGTGSVSAAPSWGPVSYSDVGGAAHVADVQVFTTAGVNTWTKPTTGTPKTVHVFIVAGGGGGGGGAQLASGTAMSGGGAGGGGGAADMNFDASVLGATETVTIGAGSSGGTAGSTSVGGDAGNSGGNTTFGSWLAAYGGGGGRGGQSAATAGGGGGGGSLAVGGNGAGGGGGGTLGGANSGSSPSAQYGGPGGPGGASGVIGTAGTSAFFAGGSGGSGAGIAVSPVALAGGAGGKNSMNPTAAVAGAANGNGNPGSVATGAFFSAGSGGSGGGSSTAAAAGSGGAGARGGGGGGGGAALTSTATAAAGGKGGDGYAIVVTTF